MNKREAGNGLVFLKNQVLIFDTLLAYWQRPEPQIPQLPPKWDSMLMDTHPMQQHAGRNVQP